MSDRDHRETESDDAPDVLTDVGEDAAPCEIPGVASSSAIGGLLEVVSAAVGARDLEGHLALLVLHSGYHAGATNDDADRSPWARAVDRLLASDPTPEGPLKRTHDVATVGVRLALGGTTTRVAEFESAAIREIARDPFPPAACVKDDERFLLGVAAGIGIATPAVAAALTTVLRAREHIVPLRQLTLDLWAEALAHSAPRFTGDVARRAMRYLATPSAGRPAARDGDRVAVFWLATRLLEAPWEPTDEDLARLDVIIADGRRAVPTFLTGQTLAPLDAALLLDGLSASPLGRLARRTALEGVLAVVDAFPASARVFANRQRNRAPLTIADEYDVQDLFHALALPVVPDIVPEDPAAKLAGKSIRLDFTSRTARLGFELKHVKSASHVEKVREEVLLDERTYQEHPYVDTVIVFISDPGRHVPEHARAAFETDLSQVVTVGGRTVQYITRVRG